MNKEPLSSSKAKIVEEMASTSDQDQSLSKPEELCSQSPETKKIRVLGQNDHAETYRILPLNQKEQLIVAVTCKLMVLLVGAVEVYFGLLQPLMSFPIHLERPVLTWFYMCLWLAAFTTVTLGPVILLTLLLKRWYFGSWTGIRVDHGPEYVWFFAPRRGQSPSKDQDAAPFQIKTKRAQPGDESCPYCREVFETVGAGRIRCPDCQTPYHKDCARELRVCGSLGCAGTLHRGPAGPAVDKQVEARRNPAMGMKEPEH